MTRVRCAGELDFSLFLDKGWAFQACGIGMASLASALACFAVRWGADAGESPNVPPKKEKRERAFDSLSQKECFSNP